MPIAPPTIYMAKSVRSGVFRGAPHTQRSHITASDQPLTPFPPFPIELVRLIVEDAAYQSRGTTEALARVCLQFYKWLLPSLFKTISLHASDAKVAHFARRLKHRRYRLPISHHVHTIHFLGPIAYTSLPPLNAIFTLCHNLKNVSFDPDVLKTLCGWYEAYSPAPFWTLRPRKVALHAHGPCSPPVFGAPLFEAVTHLHLPLAFLPHIASFHERGGMKLRMRSLTHLAFEEPYTNSHWRWYPVSVTHLNQVLAVPTLTVLVLWLPTFSVSRCPFEQKRKVHWIEDVISFVAALVGKAKPREDPVDPRIVMCRGPLPGNERGRARKYDRMPDGLWEWADETAMTQTLTLRREPVPPAPTPPWRIPSWLTPLVVLLAALAGLCVAEWLARVFVVWFVPRELRIHREAFYPQRNALHRRVPG